MVIALLTQARPFRGAAVWRPDRVRQSGGGLTAPVATASATGRRGQPSVWSLPAHALGAGGEQLGTRLGAAVNSGTPLFCSLRKGTTCKGLGSRPEAVRGRGRRRRRERSRGGGMYVRLGRASYGGERGR